jgi:ribosome maturation factor RimP
MTNLDALFEPTLNGMGYELVEVETSPKGLLVRVFIDAPGKEAGVDIDDCSLVSSQLSRMMEVENINYERLEVSSPGLDRVLNRPAHYKRFVGHEINIRLREKIEGRANWSATLTGYADGKLTITAADGKSWEVAEDNIRRARLQEKIDWSRK